MSHRNFTDNRSSIIDLVLCCAGGHQRLEAMCKKYRIEYQIITRSSGRTGRRASYSPMNDDSDKLKLGESQPEAQTERLTLISISFEVL